MNINDARDILRTINCSNQVSIEPAKILNGFDPPLHFSQYCIVYLNNCIVLKGCIASSDVERIASLVEKIEPAGNLTFFFSEPVPCSNVYIRVKFD